MLRRFFSRYMAWSVISVLMSLGLLLSACGDSSPTAKPTVTPQPTPTPAPPAYMADVEFKFADEAEKAHSAFTASQPDFAAYISWTESNHWYVLARDNTPDRLKERVGKDAKITATTYVGEALSGKGAMGAYAITLNRTTVDTKTSGAKEAAKMLYNRAVQVLSVRNGLIVFSLGNDQIHVLMPSSSSAEQVLGLSTFGKLELVAAGSTGITDGKIINTSATPPVGDLKLKDTNTYKTLIETSDFGTFAIGPEQSTSMPTGILRFELRSGAKVYDYTRANLGSYMALVFDRQVLSSAVIKSAIRDKAEINVRRWVGSAGQTEMQRFVDLMNATPPQVFESKEVLKSPTLVFSGSFAR
jgi:hypothetical protein